MGNAAIYCYPSDGAALTTVDFGVNEPISNLVDTPRRLVEDDEGYDGSPSIHPRHAGLDVRIVLENFDDEDLAYSLMSLSAHLERGGTIGFTADTDTAWAAYTSKAPKAGQTATVNGGSAFHNPSATLSMGDYVAVEGPLPQGNREWIKVNTFATKLLTSTAGLLYDYDGPALLRERDYYPVLYWPKELRRPGQAIVTHDQRLNWTLDVTLRMDYGAIFALSSADGALLRTTSESNKPTLEQAISKHRTQRVAEGGGRSFARVRQ